MLYHHPLAYLLGTEGLALLRAWAGEGPNDEAFVQRRIAAIRTLLDDRELAATPGVTVRQDATEAAYAEWASDYDDPENGLFDMDEPIIDEILDGIIDELGVGRALDAGCGTGRLTQRLSERGYETVGTDGSEAMLALARKRLPACTFEIGALDHLPVPDDDMDLAITALALSHVPDLEPVYAEFARVLRPGGDLVVSDVHPELVLFGSTVKGLGPEGQALLASTHRHSTGDHLRAALAAGFEVLRCEDHPRPVPIGADPLPEPTREIGDWKIWPWTLLGRDPEAARSAWNNPAITVWHFRSAHRA